MVKSSQAFAAARQAVIMELMNKVYDELLPQFNSEVEDIRHKYNENIEIAQEQPTENARKKLVELGEAWKKARTLDLVKRKNDFIESLRLRLRVEQLKVIEDYKGECFMEQESPREDGKSGGKPRNVEKVKFSDGSVAKVAQNLFIDYTEFQRV